RHFRRVLLGSGGWKIPLFPTRMLFYFAFVQKGVTTAVPESSPGLWWRTPLPQSYVGFLCGKLLGLLHTLHGLSAFALITFGVMVRKVGVARQVIYPLLVKEVARCGLALLPMIFFVALALGLVVIGQTVSLLTRVGANALLGTIMVSSVVRELGPLLTALLVLSRIGSANVIELGTARAQGEVEALEVLGIDPVHYLVVPRVVGIALGVFGLTVYLILGALASG